MGTSARAKNFSEVVRYSNCVGDSQLLAKIGQTQKRAKEIRGISVWAGFNTHGKLCIFFPTTHFLEWVSCGYSVLR